MKIAGLALVAAAFIAAPASAATFVVTNSLPGFGIANCKGAVKSGAFATGTVVASSDYTGGCNGAYSVALDTMARTLTLNVFQRGDYQLNTLDIGGITEFKIAGFSTVSSTNFFENGSEQPAPQLSFTEDTLSLRFAVADPTGTREFIYNNGGSAVFSYSVEPAAGAVPEPATWGMMILGVGVVGASMRRRKSTVRTSVSFT